MLLYSIILICKIVDTDHLGDGLPWVYLLITKSYTQKFTFKIFTLPIFQKCGKFHKMKPIRMLFIGKYVIVKLSSCTNNNKMCLISQLFDCTIYTIFFSRVLLLDHNINYVNKILIINIFLSGESFLSAFLK